MSAPVAVVSGMLASYNVGGVAWDYAEYAVALERLGFDVYYLEDTAWTSFDPRSGYYSEDYSYGARFVDESLRLLSPALGARWHVLGMDGASYGLERDHMIEIVQAADLFLNVSGAAVLRPEYLPSRCKVLIDTDPGWNHFVNWRNWNRNSEWPDSAPFTAHDRFFTYAERIGAADCPLPDYGVQWHPTRPPVVLDQWQPEPPGSTWTTVMTWKNYDKVMEHAGVRYGTKEVEFARVETLPACVDARLEVAVGGGSSPDDHWRSLGWSVIDSLGVSPTAADYRSYVQRSRGEFSVAKHVYAATNCGWFSCRSVCYLAAGRPVVVQDTGFSELIPTGEGLFSFRSLDEAVSAIDKVEADYDHHAAAARAVAAEHFEAEHVVSDLLSVIAP